MTIRALVSFAGKVIMQTGETAEVDGEIARQLLACGFAEEVKSDKRKAMKKDEAKSDNG